MRSLTGAGGAFTVAAALCIMSGCTPHANRLELGLRDPTAVRVELHDPSPFGASSERIVSLNERQEGNGGTLRMRTGMLLDRYDAAARVTRKEGGELEMQFERIPEDDEPPDSDYSIRHVIWQRDRDGLRFSTRYFTQDFGTRVDSAAAGWRFDRAATPRLTITSSATFQAAGFVGEQIQAPNVTISTPMQNVRWARAVAVEDSSLAWWYLGATVLAGGIAASQFYLSGLPEKDGPIGFFVATGIGASSIGVLTLVLTIRAFVRGQRETKYDLVTPLP